MDYFKRIADDLIEYYGQYAGAIYVRGPKWVGKTTTVSRHAKTVYRLGNSRNLSNFEFEYGIDPQLVFGKDKPILFDEWQEAPYLWDEIKTQIDINEGKNNQFLLTGSRELSKEEKEKHLRHTGVGRILDFTMYPLSLYESGESNGSISLSDLFDETYSVTGKVSSLSLDDLIFATCRGGWPLAMKYGKSQLALEQASLFVSSTINRSEIGQDDDDLGEKGDPYIFERFLYSYSRNLCTMVSDETILKGINGGGKLSISRPTYDNYKKKFRKQYVIEEVDPWCPAFKSRSNVLTTPKKALVDPSIAVASLGLSPQKMLSSLIDFGFFFENLVIRDLRVYGMKNHAKISYYHDRNGLECDAVYILPDKRYALIEVKLGLESAKNAAASLVKIKGLIEAYNATVADQSEIMDLPSALIVIHGGDKAYTLPNGVHLVPIGCLKD